MKDDLQDLLELAMEGRRRVKEQLKKMGSFEFFQTSFSYTDRETGEERYVGVPEEGGRNMIASDPLEPGTRMWVRAKLSASTRRETALDSVESPLSVFGGDFASYNRTVGP